MSQKLPFGFGRMLFHTVLGFILIVACAALVLRLLLAVGVPTSHELTAPALIASAAVVLAALEYRRKLAFDRSTLAVNFMLRFYENRDLAELRRLLRKRCPIEIHDENGAIREDVILLMNFFEALAIAEGEKCFDVGLVNKMLGAVIVEIAANEMSRSLREKRYDYEVFFGDLVPQIKTLRGIA